MMDVRFGYLGSIHHLHLEVKRRPWCFRLGGAFQSGGLFSKLEKPCIDWASGSLQDKQDKLTATTAKNRKNELRGLIGCRACIYLLSEANGPL
jgi:hypothetical protein